ncbi:MAG: Na+/H+ antiporter NhaC, partial [Leptospiraceae bacterium]|nr:Na+/H+ antiporter NhaC [Leptospiraceae bacterium]
GPGFFFFLSLFFILGRTISLKEFDAQRVEIVIAAVRGEFNTSLYMLVPMVILFGMVAARTPAIPSLLVGSLMGIAMAIIFQPEALVQFAGASGLDYAVVAVKGGVRAAAIGYASHSGVPAVDDLLSRGGMVSMLTTVWLIMSAMFFSGIMEGSGMLHTIAESILKMVRGTGNLILATVVTAIFMNLTTSDQYMSIVISGRMYTRAYDREGLAPENLSRVLEDAGTLTSPLVPWNTCGAFMARTLSVPTWEYLPFAFLNLINPLISILYGYTGFTIHRKVQSADAIESGVNESGVNESGVNESGVNEHDAK